MTEHELDTYLELPIKVCFDAQPEERATRDYPGCPASIELNCIEIYGIMLPEDLFQKILVTEGYFLEEECRNFLK